MKFVTYLYGLLCVSVGIGFATYFPSLFVLEYLGKFVPAYFVEKGLLYLFRAMPFILAVIYFLHCILKLKRKGIPEDFKGWRYLSTALGFAVLILGALPMATSFISKPATGSMSGIPFALGLIFSFILVLPAMTTPRK